MIKCTCTVCLYCQQMMKKSVQKCVFEIDVYKYLYLYLIFYTNKHTVFVFKYY